MCVCVCVFCGHVWSAVRHIVPAALLGDRQYCRWEYKACVCLAYMCGQLSGTLCLQPCLVTDETADGSSKGLRNESVAIRMVSCQTGLLHLGILFGMDCLHAQRLCLLIVL